MTNEGIGGKILANWFKEEIAHFGTTVDSSIQKASIEIQTHIDRIGATINAQRALTAHDIEKLIDYAADAFGDSIDKRVAAAKEQIAELVTEKIGEVRAELTAAANEQKRTAVRNASIAITSAIGIGVLSLGYRQFLHGEIDLMFVFRAVLGALAVGHLVWVVQHYVARYVELNRTQRSILMASARYVGILRPKGAWGHLLVLALLLMAWFGLNFWAEFKAMLFR